MMLFSKPKQRLNIPITDGNPSIAPNSRVTGTWGQTRARNSVLRSVLEIRNFAIDTNVSLGGWIDVNAVGVGVDTWLAKIL